MAALHERAGDWYAANGHPEDALEHALAAGALDRATELISQHALPRLMRADAGTVIRWIRSLPAEWLDRRPELRLTYAWALVLQLEVPGRRGAGAGGRAAFAAGTSPEIEGNLAILRGILTLVAGRTREAIDLYERALERLPEDGDSLRGFLFLELGMAYLIDDDVAAAEAALREVPGRRTAAPATPSGSWSPSGTSPRSGSPRGGCTRPSPSPGGRCGWPRRADGTPRARRWRTASWPRSGGSGTTCRPPWSSPAGPGSWASTGRSPPGSWWGASPWPACCNRWGTSPAPSPRSTAPRRS